MTPNRRRRLSRPLAVVSLAAKLKEGAEQRAAEQVEEEHRRREALEQFKLKLSGQGAPSPSERFRTTLGLIHESTKPADRKAALNLMKLWIKQHGKHRAVLEAETISRAKQPLVPTSQRHLTPEQAKVALINLFASNPHEEYVNFLVNHGLNHADPSVRLQTIESFASIGTKAPLNHLRERAQNEEIIAVRRAAERTVHSIEGALRKYSPKPRSAVAAHEIRRPRTAARGRSMPKRRARQ